MSREATLDPVLVDAIWLSVLNMGAVMSVFVVLYLMILLVRRLVRWFEPAPVAASAASPVPVAVTAAAGPGEEEIAAIGAAVAAVLGHERFRILSVSEVLPWSRAGRAEIMAGRQAAQRAARR